MKNDKVLEMFQKYYNVALLYVFSLAKDRGVAEDIVSTAFFKALQTSDEKILSFKPWLFAVCRNTYFNHLKKNKRVQALNDDFSSERDGLLSELIEEEEYRALYRAIGLLNSEQREVITLFYFQETKVKDIAAITGKSETSVKVALYRARENLKKILEV